MRFQGAVKTSVITMGQVALTMKIMPESPEVDLAKLKQEITDCVSPQEIREKPVGFGLVALEVLLVFDDKEGANTEEIEQKLSGIEGVASVESGDITLV